MFNQKGVVAPLLIFAVLVAIIAGATLYYLGVFKAPYSTQDDYQPVITPPLSVESSPSEQTQTPAPSDYANPFSSDDTYENPFNDL